MAVAGIDIEKVLACALEELHDLDLRSSENPAWIYAGTRQHLYQAGRPIEILACFEPSFRFMAEWWKQLFGESEGKNGIGIFPASVEYSADLHSMGQFIQDGPRTLMETVVVFEQDDCSLKVPFELGDRDGLNYLAGRELSAISATVAKAVAGAHIKGEVPNILITVPKRDEAGFASLVCFFEMSCAISAYMSGVNPFNQPGVEDYKQNMFRMLKAES
jgi:glucose-6-phosphate isomerase